MHLCYLTAGFKTSSQNLIGVALGLFAGYWFGRRGERRKLTQQFYDGIEPFLRQLSELRTLGKIAPSDARLLVQTVSAGFQESFLRDASLLILKKDRPHKPGTDMVCGVCSLKVKLANDLCPNCSLDCCAWDALGSKKWAN